MTKDYTGIYIAGPMRGRPDYNFAAFSVADRVVRCHLDLFSRDDSAFEPVIFNPAWNDIVNAGLTVSGGREGYGPWSQAGEYLLAHPSEFDLRSALRDDLRFICEGAGHIVLLPGWSTSAGARTEVALAQALGLRVWVIDLADPSVECLYKIPLGAPIPDPEKDRLSGTKEDRLFAPEWIADAVAGEVRTTSRTGGQKGSKPERYDLIPWEAMDEVARVYGFGANKYAAHNWRRKYEWGKSIAALLRHVTQFVKGNTYDEETGLHHLAHAVFHCLALIVWTSEDGEGSEFDDRFRPGMLERAILKDIVSASEYRAFEDAVTDRDHMFEEGADR